MPADRRDLRRSLFSLAADQAGYFTAAQAKSIGYTYPAQAHHVRAGNWMRVDRGVFRLMDWVDHEHDGLARWYLWSKQRAVVSHESAMSVHGVGEFEAPRLQLTVPPGFRMRDRAVQLHFAELPEKDIERSLAFPVTTVIRTLIDIAAEQADSDQLVTAVAEALARGTFTTRQLRVRAEAVDPVAALHLERAMRVVESE